MVLRALFFLSTITYATKVNWFWICSWLISSFTLQRLYFHICKRISSWENTHTMMGMANSLKNRSRVKLFLETFLNKSDSMRCSKGKTNGFAKNVEKKLRTHCAFCFCFSSPPHLNRSFTKDQMHRFKANNIPKIAVCSKMCFRYTGNPLYLKWMMKLTQSETRTPIK